MQLTIAILLKCFSLFSHTKSKYDFSDIGTSSYLDGTSNFSKSTFRLLLLDENDTILDSLVSENFFPNFLSFIPDCRRRAINLLLNIMLLLLMSHKKPKSIQYSCLNIKMTPSNTLKKSMTRLFTLS